MLMGVNAFLWFEEVGVRCFAKAKQIQDPNHRRKRRRVRYVAVMDAEFI